ncbi:MAG: hypothetical protein H6Q69_4781 [Firmicutes bacterium]|nr:hypothetical protein [Bacillota bacterium]
MYNTVLLTIYITNLRGAFMKKIIILLLFLVLFTTSGFAADSQEIKYLIPIVTDYQNLNNSFYTGITYNQFLDANSKINDKVKSFQEINPNSFTTELNDLNTMYNYINSLWEAKADNLSMVVPNQTSKELQRKYPGIETIVRKGIMGGWNPDSTIMALNYLAKEKLGKLAIPLKGFELTYGFQYADGLIGNSIFVSIVAPKSSAYQAGLRFGDRITKVNDIPVKDVDTFTSMLSGPEGSRLKFHVKTDDAAEKVLEITKTIIHQ